MQARYTTLDKLIVNKNLHAHLSEVTMNEQNSESFSVFDVPLNDMHQIPSYIIGKYSAVEML